MTDVYANFRATLHGIDAENVGWHRDERYRALWIELFEGVSIRVDLKYPDDARRDRAGLLKLAEVATRVAQEIGQAEDGA
jgi:hypothetical protein